MAYRRLKGNWLEYACIYRALNLVVLLEKLITKVKTDKTTSRKVCHNVKDIYCTATSSTSSKRTEKSLLRSGRNEMSK